MKQSLSNLKRLTELVKQVNQHVEHLLALELLRRWFTNHSQESKNIQTHQSLTHTETLLLCLPHLTFICHSYTMRNTECDYNNYRIIWIKIIIQTCYSVKIIQGIIGLWITSALTVIGVSKWEVAMANLWMNESNESDFFFFFFLWQVIQITKPA